MTEIHRFKVDKLIRDNLPQIMRASGIQVFERIMEKDEYLKRLKDKLLEEAKEVIESGSKKEMREELADLLEVILALAFVEIEAGNPSLGYYRARPDQYPEVK